MAPCALASVLVAAPLAGRSEGYLASKLGRPDARKVRIGLPQVAALADEANRAGLYRGRFQFLRERRGGLAYRDAQARAWIRSCFQQKALARQGGVDTMPTIVGRIATYSSAGGPE
jgi:hypothetical protein